MTAVKWQGVLSANAGSAPGARYPLSVDREPECVSARSRATIDSPDASTPGADAFRLPAHRNVERVPGALPALALRAPYRLASGSLGV